MNRDLLRWMIYLFTFLFFVWDLGNLDAIRQSTEGFYLQIAKEMHELGSYLTPKYLGLNHWSKPPVHFWLSLFFTKTFSQVDIFYSRLSIALLSFFGLIFFSKWIKRNFKTDELITFIFLASSFGVIRYSRIYMMEIPLTFFALFSSFKLYDYLQEHKIKDLLFSSFWMGISILVKGPISLVMVAGGYLLYFIRFRELPIKNLLFFGLLSLILPTSWFLISHFNYPDEFFQTFFLDQNMGKFNAKSYPIKVLFQGLFVFSLPWVLYLPSFLKDFKNELGQKKFFFLFTQFIGFYLIWFFPAQKSHHYAFPGSVILLFIIAILLSKKEKFSLYPIRFFGVLYIFLTLALLFFGYFHFSIVLFLIFSLGMFFRKTFLYSSLLSIGILWVLILPLFYLPYVPQKTIDLIGEKPLAVVARKPYFIEEVVNTKKMEVLDPGAIKEYIKSHNELYFVHQEVYEGQKLNEVSEVLYQWKIWKRGSKFKDILNALKQKDLSLLREQVFLLKNQRVAP